ncbi:MAG: hypothetical protein ACYCWW_12185 [Deltaproteobacteria bacterium]
MQPVELLTIAAGPGIDQPTASDLSAFSGSINRPTSNLAIYASATYAFPGGFSASFEYNYLHTAYQSELFPTASVASLNTQLAF